MTASEWPAGAEAPDLGRFEPSPYDLGITDDPDPDAYAREAAAAWRHCVIEDAKVWGEAHAGEVRASFEPSSADPEPEAEPW